MLMIRIAMPDGIDRPGLQPVAITEAQAIADAGTVTDACGTVDVTACRRTGYQYSGLQMDTTWTVTATTPGQRCHRQVTTPGRWILTIRNSPHARRHRST
ncbi:MAG: hypothetical protein IPK76_19655 [Lewinellaceae bacterium]|nr:hypothetical protein [Lewinellaceae bacterium]